MHLGRVAAPLLIAALVAACSSAAATAAPTAAPASAPASVAAASAAPSMAATAPASAAASASSGGGYGGGGDSYGSAGKSPAAAAGGLALAKTSLGTVLVGPTGDTLYMFTPDSSTSATCTGSCAANWPPLTGDLPSLGAGLTAADFGSVSRADGTKQVSFHGHPLYYFAGDKAPGDTNGQGIGGKWYVIGADGNPIK